jgi:signal transduction histidine kinase
LDVDTVIEEVLVLARGELQQHRIEVRTELDAGLPPVLGDRMQLQQVLLNLIINAIQSMSGVHDRPRDLAIRCKKGAPDDGVIITAHGGRIWASPGESVGATFRIVLPSKHGVEGDQVR